MNALPRLFAAIFACACMVSLAWAQEAPAPAAGDGGADASEAPALRILNKKHVNEDLKTAVRKGVKRLAELQDANGAFTRSGGQNIAIAITGLAGLALVASGSTPDKGPHATNVRKAMEYLLSCQDRNTGYITGANDGSRIHGHGYATLFLTQILGSLQNQAERTKLEKAIQDAVKCIENGQTKFGGWGYVPDDLTWDEGSTTVCCIQALRAASDAGINVKMKTIQMAIKYMYDTADQRRFTHEGNDYTGYTFRYSLSSGWNSDSYALCAAGIATLNGIGVYSEGATWKEHEIGKVYKGGLLWLRYKLDDFNGRRKAGQGSLDVSHFYYAHFYACQAMWNAPEDVYFDEYFPKLRDMLVEEQKRNPANNGGWASQSYGEAYTSAYALLILLVPYQVLPLYSK
ncbi:MAG: terpene cyclase/mutase family protein [Planctomycetes bacterium]|nr:terpene cyclase/mutase family protein [Planctomycetota bacterium]